MRRIRFRSPAALAATLLVAACLPGFGFEHQIKGSGHAASESRAVDGFDRVQGTGSTDGQITIGQAFSVRVTADDNVVPIIETVVDGKTLEVRTKDHTGYSSKTPSKVEINLPSLRGAGVSGAADITIAGMNGGNLDLEISGAGNIVATGTVDAVHAEVAGAGDMTLTDLKAKEADVSIAGSGDVSLRVDDRLGVSIAGAGDVHYAGKPRISKMDINGAGSVSEIK